MLTEFVFFFSDGRILMFDNFVSRKKRTKKKTKYLAVCNCFYLLSVVFCFCFSYGTWWNLYYKITQKQPKLQTKPFATWIFIIHFKYKCQNIWDLFFSTAYFRFGVESAVMIVNLVCKTTFSCMWNDSH